MASIAKRPNGRWRARYRDHDRREHSRHFDRKVDAQRWLDGVTADLVTGRYVDPRAARTTFGEFAAGWLAGRTSDPSSLELTESRLRLHVLPTFGDLELGNIRPSTVQQWMRDRSEQFAPRTVRSALVVLSAVLSAAVEDGLLHRNPCTSSTVRPPAIDPQRVEPWSVEQVAGIIDAHPDHYRAVAVVAAGGGLRQGEVFGLAVDDVDFLRRSLRVRRQVKLLHGKPVFGPTKGRKERVVPLPDAVCEALAEHLRVVGPTVVTLPWAELDGRQRTFELLFAAEPGRPLNRNLFNRHVWQPAVAAAGIEHEPNKTGMHALRHYYASVLLHDGVSIAAVADYLGHHDPTVTLRTYAHLMPASDDRARSVLDAALSRPADYLRTADTVR